MTRTIAFVLLAVAPVLAADPPAALKPFQGKWVVSAATLGGRDHKDDFASLKLTVTGDKYETTLNILKDAGAVTVNAAKSPKWLTLTSSEMTEPFKGRTMPGIYEFTGGKLLVCLNSEKADRPTKFDAPEKTPLMLIEFTKSK